MDRRYLAVVILTLLFCGTSAGVSASDVRTLTKEDFDLFLSSNKFTLVNFCAPWNNHCKFLEPQYAQVAVKLAERGSDVQLAFVDVSVETVLAEEHKIHRYPTLRLFKEGVLLSEYSGAAVVDRIVRWIAKKTGSGAEVISTTDQAKEFTNSSDVVVLGFFRDLEAAAAQEFLKTAWAMDNFLFGITDKQEIFEEYQVSADCVLVIKEFDDGRAVMETDLTSSAIARFVQIESLPLVVQFGFDSLQTIFRGAVKSQLLFFIGRSDPDIERIINEARAVAKEFKGKVLFVGVDIENKDNKQLFDFFGLKFRRQFPCMRITSFSEQDLVKYKPQSPELTADNMRIFAQSYLDGSLEPYLISQTLPEDWDEKPVKVLVASNFDSVTRDASKDVLVHFHAPWNEKSKELVPIFTQLGDMYDNEPSVVIAQFDTSANELHHTKIRSFPSVKLYRKNDNAVIDFEGEATLEDLVSFLEQNTERPSENADASQRNEEL